MFKVEKEMALSIFVMAALWPRLDGSTHNFFMKFPHNWLDSWVETTTFSASCAVNLCQQFSSNNHSMHLNSLITSVSSSFPKSTTPVLDSNCLYMHKEFRGNTACGNMVLLFLILFH